MKKPHAPSAPAWEEQRDSVLASAERLGLGKPIADTVLGESIVWRFEKGTIRTGLPKEEKRLGS